jgi:RHS repeat-associated protein
MPSQIYSTTFSETCTGWACYGFNGKENDNDVFGTTGSFQDYGMRMYDTRVAKFISIDPLTKKYPYYSPYQFAGNKPIQYVDIDGLEEGGGSSPTSPAKEIKGDNGLPSGYTSAVDNATVKTAPVPDIHTLVKQNQLHASQQAIVSPPQATISSTSNLQKWSETMIEPEGTTYGNMVRYDFVTKAAAAGGLVSMGVIETAAAVPELYNAYQVYPLVQGAVGGTYGLASSYYDLSPDMPNLSKPIADFTAQGASLLYSYATNPPGEHTQLTNTNATQTQTQAQSQAQSQSSQQTQTQAQSQSSQQTQTQAKPQKSYNWSNSTNSQTNTATPNTTTNYTVTATGSGH